MLIQFKNKIKFYLSLYIYKKKKLKLNIRQHGKVLGLKSLKKK